MVEGLICYICLDDLFECVLYIQGWLLLLDDEVWVVDVEGCEVGFGEVGELIVCGFYIICGYYCLFEYNVKVFSVDGFYCIGDWVSCDKDGYLVVEGCDKDQINCGGEKIVVEEVENLLIVYLQVYDVIVVVMFDSLFGECICVFVILCQLVFLVLKLK